MGLWANTAYIYHADSRAVADGLTQLFEAEGMRAIPRPPQRKRSSYEPMQYASGARNNLWGVAVIPGAPGWTVIQSAPLELLAERPAPDRKMRLASLCERLQAPGALLNVYDGSAGLLLEADSEGRVVLSGVALDSAQNPDPMWFYGEPISMEHLSIEFQVLPLQSVVKNCEHDAISQPGQRLIDEEMLATTLAELLGGSNARLCNNLTSVDTLICHKPLEAVGGRDLYFEWPPRDRDETLGAAGAISTKLGRRGA